MRDRPSSSRDLGTKERKKKVPYDSGYQVRKALPNRTGGGGEEETYKIGDLNLVEYKESKQSPRSRLLNQGYR